MSTQTSTSITPVGYHCIVCLLMKDTLGAHQRHFSYNSEIRDWLRVFINNHTRWSMFTLTEPRCMSRRCRTTCVGYVHTSREVSIYSPVTTSVLSSWDATVRHRWKVWWSFDIHEKHMYGPLRERKTNRFWSSGNGVSFGGLSGSFNKVKESSCNSDTSSRFVFTNVLLMFASAVASPSLTELWSLVEETLC